MTIGAALVPVTTGVFVLLWCVRDFYVAGRGTLAPWAPPRRLVRTGLYRFSRNPMYVGVLSILVGWATGFRSWPLALYAAFVALGFHLRVVLYEEPTLARSFSREWEQVQVAGAALAWRSASPHAVRDRTCGDLDGNASAGSG